MQFFSSLFKLLEITNYICRARLWDRRGFISVAVQFSEGEF